MFVIQVDPWKKKKKKKMTPYFLPLSIPFLSKTVYFISTAIKSVDANTHEFEISV